VPATLATIDALLKEVYRGQVREQLNQEIVALKRIQGSSAGITSDIGGKYVTFPIHVSRNAGIGSRLEGEALPVPGQQGMVPARVGLKYGYGAFQITGQAIRLSDSDPQAFAKAMDVEISNLKLDILKDMNRQVYGTGNGAFATVRAVGTTTAVIPVADARLAQIGARIDIIRLSGGAYSSTVLASTVATPVTIIAVDLTAGANTITISTTTTVAVGDIITRAGSGISAAGNRELTGLAAIVDNTSTLFNINPATTPAWAAVVAGNAGTNRALSEGLMIQMVHQVRVNGGKTSLIIQGLELERSYFNLLSQTRSTVNSQEFTGGYKGLAFTTASGEIPVVSDPDAPLNTQWFLNEDTFTYYRDEEWDWVDQMGSYLQQVVDANGRYDAYVAYMREYHELGIDRRNTNGVLRDLAGS
jgi:hypothetical protein